MKKVFMITATVLAMLLTACGPKDEGSSQTAEVQSAAPTVTEAQPDMTEEEAIAIAKNLINSELSSIPKSEFVFSEYPYITFEQVREASFDECEVTYNASSNMYVVDAKGDAFVKYSVNGVGLAGQSIYVEFDTTVRVMIRNGDASFANSFNYEIVDRT